MSNRDNSTATTSSAKTMMMMMNSASSGQQSHVGASSTTLEQSTITTNDSSCTNDSTTTTTATTTTRTTTSTESLRMERTARLTSLKKTLEHRLEDICGTVKLLMTEIGNHLEVTHTVMVDYQDILEQQQQESSRLDQVHQAVLSATTYPAFLNNGTNSTANTDTASNTNNSMDD